MLKDTTLECDCTHGLRRCRGTFTHSLCGGIAHFHTIIKLLRSTSLSVLQPSFIFILHLALHLPFIFSSPPVISFQIQYIRRADHCLLFRLLSSSFCRCFLSGFVREENKLAGMRSQPDTEFLSCYQGCKIVSKRIYGVRTIRHL